MAKDAVALLLIGGLGTRYGTVPPKQFQTYDGLPLFIHAAKKLESVVGRVIYVCHPSYLNLAKEMLDGAGLRSDEIVLGGSSRQESVKNGLTYLVNKISSDSIIVISDGNRPNITEKMILGVINKAEINGSAVTAYRSTNSILTSIDGNKARQYLNREEIYIVQTPQAFRYSLILKAIKNAKRDYTDDGSLVMEVEGISPLIEEGSESNVKITTKEGD